MTQVSFSADCKASATDACRRILSAEGLEAWWIGKVKILKKDQDWPAKDSTMTWSAGGGIFSAKITDDSRPEKVVMFVNTPSAGSLITNKFEPIEGGGTRYTKIVETKARTFISKIFMPLLVILLKRFVKIEVMKAALYADKSENELL